MTIPDARRQIALALLAHPDDAEFLCGGTLIRLAECGWKIHVATATAGDCGSTTLPSREIADIRRNEAIEAVRAIGGEYHCLEEIDVRVAFDKPTVQKAIDLMRSVAPSIVLTHPRRDYMLDHEQVHLLARGATFAYPIPNASPLPLIEGCRVPWLYYCDPIEMIDPYNGESAPKSTSIDISACIDLKAKMLACHASQREWLQAHHGMDEYLESMKRHSATRGKELGVPYAEAFLQHRGHPYPQSDILTEILGGK